MPRPKLIAPPEPTRRDTIGLHTTVKYDPMAPRATTPILVGTYVVMRRPIPDSVHTQYMIMDGNVIVRTSISYPGEHDCKSAVENHRVRAAASMTGNAIAKAKRKPRSFRVRAKEVA